MIKFQRSHILTLDDIDLAEQVVFLRVDLNAPVKDGVVTNDARIKAILPSLQFLLESKARVVLASHFGRPKGKVQEQYSLMPVAQRLSELIDQDLIFADDCIGDGVKKLIQDTKNQLILLENLRFHEGEEAGDEAFAQSLAEHVDVYVTDAFGALHRDHASVTKLPKVMKTSAVGRLIEKELSYLTPLSQDPTRPYGVILGGAKISDKIKVVEQLLKKVNRLFIGGAMAFTFMKAKGMPIGDSLYEEHMLDYAKKIMKEAAERKISIFFPRDFQVAQSFDAKTSKITDGASIDPGWMGLDVGPQTVAYFSEYLQGLQTVFWNGPMGVFEKKPFDVSTMAIAKVVASLDGTKIVGGGDSVAAVELSGVADKMDHISTGGGATLKFLQDPELVGLMSVAVLS